MRDLDGRNAGLNIKVFTETDRIEPLAFCVASGTQPSLGTQVTSLVVSLAENRLSTNVI
jgi:hypothetical protein